MIRSRVIPADEQEHYWDVVARCLTEFHGLSATLAMGKVAEFRSAIERLPRRTVELFFNREPFDVACRIAETSRDVIPVLARYLEIRDRPGLDLDEVKAG